MQKLGNDSSQWKINEWFAELNVQLDKIMKEDGKEYFRMYRWKWVAKSAHEPHVAVVDMGMPASAIEMEEFIEEKRYMRAEAHTEAAYIQYITKDESRIDMETRITNFYETAETARLALRRGRELVAKFCPESFLGPLLKGKIDSWESFQLQLRSTAKSESGAPTYPTLLNLRKMMRDMTRKTTSSVEKMRGFRDELDSYYIKREKEGFEYPDIEGDDLFFKGSEDFSPIISTIGLLLSTMALSDEDFATVEDEMLKTHGEMNSKILNQNKFHFYHRVGELELVAAKKKEEQAQQAKEKKEQNKKATEDAKKLKEAKQLMAKKAHESKKANEANKQQNTNKQKLNDPPPPYMPNQYGPAQRSAPVNSVPSYQPEYHNKMQPNVIHPPNLPQNFRQPNPSNRGAPPNRGTAPNRGQRGNYAPRPTTCPTPNMNVGANAQPNRGRDGRGRIDDRGRGRGRGDDRGRGRGRPRNQSRNNAPQQMTVQVNLSVPNQPNL